MPLNLPTRHNDQLQRVLDKINADAELHQLWKCANINAVDRSAISDHGEVHIRIVANAALRLLRLLCEAGIQTSVEKNYGLTQAEAEVIVVLASCFHDVGIAIHRDNHETYSLYPGHPQAARDCWRACTKSRRAPSSWPRRCTPSSPTAPSRPA